MTAVRFCDILKHMKAATILAALLALAVSPAGAADQEFDLGFARPGMMQNQFRAAAWPAGVKVFCSNDQDRPHHWDQDHFDLPKGISRLGASRCGLFTLDGAEWRLYRLDVAGWSTDVWGMFFPDGSGTPRLVQLLLKQPKDAFAPLAAHFAAHFGEPQERSSHLARWGNASNDATIIEDGDGKLRAYVIDNRLQAAMNTRMSHHTNRPMN